MFLKKMLKSTTHSETVAGIRGDHLLSQSFADERALYQRWLAKLGVPKEEVNSILREGVTKAEHDEYVTRRSLRY